VETGGSGCEDGLGVEVGEVEGDNLIGEEIGDDTWMLVVGAGMGLGSCEPEIA
jgi:hypothetical protein